LHCDHLHEKVTRDMRLGDSSFSSPAHDYDGWYFLRRQLGAPLSSWGAGAAPALPLLALEFQHLHEQAIRRRELPVQRGRGGVATFRSLQADLGEGLRRVGPRIRALADASDALTAFSVAAPTPEEWLDALAAGGATASRLLDEQAADAALDDLLEATASIETDREYGRFADRLAVVRAVTELRGTPWTTARRRLEQVLTVDDDGDGRPIVNVDALREALKERLRTAPPTRRWVVWIATLAGPGAQNDHPAETVIAGPVAVCGTPCSQPLDAWFERARGELGAAFHDQAGEVPEDVLALGEPMRYGDHVVLDSEQLWGSLTQPPSFLSRVAVDARSQAEATALAFGALRAVFGRYEPRIADDLRADPWIWGPNGGWWHGSSARDRALGEVFATRRASAAVWHWADDLGASLDQDRLASLQARALIVDDRVDAEVRLLRAATRLDAMPREGGGWINALQNLWLRHVYELHSGDQRYLLDLALSRSHCPPAPGRSHAEVAAAQAHLDEWVRRCRPKVGTALMEAIETALDPVHPDADAWDVFHWVAARLDAPGGIADGRAAHLQACQRAQRHRNTVAHGWTLPEAVLVPSVDFLALQLEMAIIAQNEAGDTVGQRRGSLNRRPPDRWQHRAVRELFDAQAS
jgi:hypothetical protein